MSTPITVEKIWSYGPRKVRSILGKRIKPLRQGWIKVALYYCESKELCEEDRKWVALPNFASIMMNVDSIEEGRQQVIFSYAYTHIFTLGILFHAAHENMVRLYGRFGDTVLFGDCTIIPYMPRPPVDFRRRDVFHGKVQNILWSSLKAANKDIGHDQSKAAHKTWSALIRCETIVYRKIAVEDYDSSFERLRDQLVYLLNKRSKSLTPIAQAYFYVVIWEIIDVSMPSLMDRFYKDVVKTQHRGLFTSVHVPVVDLNPLLQCVDLVTAHAFYDIIDGYAALPPTQTVIRTRFKHLLDQPRQRKTLL